MYNGNAQSREKSGRFIFDLCLFLFFDLFKVLYKPLRTPALFCYQINLFLRKRHTEVSTSSIPISFSLLDVYAMTTITNKQDLGQRRTTTSRDALTKRKVDPNRRWRGMGQLSARYITAILRTSSSGSLFLCLPARRLPYFLSVWITPTTPP